MKIKNVRPGIVIIADAGLKLSPGETIPVKQITPQMQSAVDAGLIARIDAEGEKPKGKGAQKTGEETKTDDSTPDGDKSGGQ